MEHISQFVSIAFGKPGAKYNYSREGMDDLTKVHADMGITSEHFEIVASHLQGCMEVLSFALFASIPLCVDMIVYNSLVRVHDQLV